MVRTIVLFIFLILSQLSFSQSKKKDKLKYADGRDLIHAMHKAYAPDRWYRYFTFSQDMDFYRNDSIVRREVWHEAYKPGSLLVKFETKDSKNGRLYTNFTQYTFKAGEEPLVAAKVHELLLVGLDVYFLKPELTVRLLDSLGFDLSKIREDDFEGKKVYVVGADKGDDTSRQFWIDREQLYMHRIVYGQKGKINDVVFDDYVKMADNWVAKTIRFKTNGKLSLIERYYDIKFPKTIHEDWFKPEKFKQVVLD